MPVFSDRYIEARTQDPVDDPHKHEKDRNATQQCLAQYNVLRMGGDIQSHSCDSYLKIPYPEDRIVDKDIKCDLPRHNSSYFHVRCAFD